MNTSFANGFRISRIQLNTNSRSAPGSWLPVPGSCFSHAECQVPNACPAKPGLPCQSLYRKSALRFGRIFRLDRPCELLELLMSKGIKKILPKSGFPESQKVRILSQETLPPPARAWRREAGACCLLRAGRSARRRRPAPSSGACGCGGPDALGGPSQAARQPAKKGCARSRRFPALPGGRRMSAWN